MCGCQQFDTTSCSGIRWRVGAESVLLRAGCHGACNTDAQPKYSTEQTGRQLAVCWQQAVPVSDFTPKRFPKTAPVTGVLEICRTATACC
jgi:hypothetical protein